MGDIDILSLNGLSLLQKGIGSISPSMIEDVTMYLKSACDQFDRALNISSEDVMWPRFINDNKARTLYFLALLSSTEIKWLEVMDEAIEFRSRLNRLIDEILTIDRSKTAKIENTHLRQLFRYQEEFGSCSQIKFNICR